MRIAWLMRMAWMLVLLGTAGWAQRSQNTDWILMAGGVNSSGSVIPGTNAMIAGSAGFGAQMNFGYQGVSTQAGSLWIETPFTWVWQGTGTITGATVTGITRDVNYITPGVRWKSPTFGRVSFYGLAGGGIGSFWKVDGVVSGTTASVTVTTSFQVSPVFDFGGGIDVRLSRLLSLRAEGRDFFSGANLDGVTGHNHPIFLVGVAFHR